MLIYEETEQWAEWVASISILGSDFVPLSQQW